MKEAGKATESTEVMKASMRRETKEKGGSKEVNGDKCNRLLEERCERSCGAAYKVALGT